MWDGYRFFRFGGATPETQRDEAKACDLICRSGPNAFHMNASRQNSPALLRYQKIVAANVVTHMRNVKQKLDASAGK